MGTSPTQLDSAITMVAERWHGKPRFGVILGTGAGNVAHSMAIDTEIPYQEIPGFPTSTVIGHKGQFVCGQLAGHDVIAMQGRFHLYEGYTDEQVLLPIALMHALGVEVLFIRIPSSPLNVELPKENGAAPTGSMVTIAGLGLPLSITKLLAGTPG